MANTGRYFLDEVSLSDLARSVESRSASMAMAGLRGENRVVPGRVGALYRNKLQEEAEFVLTMWAQGAGPDGEVPYGSTGELTVRNNIDELTRLFGDPGLHELVRAESGVNFGRKNLLPNPSFERSTGFAVSRENLAENGSLEYSNSSQLAKLRENYVDNPDFEVGARTVVLKRNLVINPRMASEESPKGYRTNMAINGSLEPGITPWKPGASSRVTYSNWANKAEGWPTKGRRSLLLQPTVANVTPRAVGASARTNAGVAHSYGCDVFNRTLAARTAVMLIRWRNKAGALISSSQGTVSVAAGKRGTIKVENVVSPANTYYVTIELANGTPANLPAGHGMEFDGIMLTTGTTLGLYFDAYTSEYQPGMRTRWAGSAYVTVAQAYMSRPQGYYTTNLQDSNREVGVTGTQRRNGSQSCVVRSTIDLTDGAALLRMRPDKGADVDPLAPVSSSSWAMLDGELSADRQVKVGLACYNSAGVLLGRALEENGSESALVTATLPPGEWIETTIEGKFARPNTASVCVEYYVGSGGALKGENFYFDTWMVEQSVVISEEYYDGAVPDDEDYDYDFVGLDHASITQVLGYAAEGWNKPNPVGYTLSRFSDAVFGRYCGRLELTPGVQNAYPAAWTQPLDFDLGREHTASAYVRHNRAVTVEIKVSYDNGSTWVAQGQAALTANTWTRISATTPVITEDDVTEVVTPARPKTVNTPAVPAKTTNSMRIQIGLVKSGSAAQDGDKLDFDGVLFEPVNNMRRWFSGTSGKGYRFLGTAGRSISVQEDQKAWGWSTLNKNGCEPFRTTENAQAVGRNVAKIVCEQTGDFGVTLASDAATTGFQYAFGIDVRLDTGLTVTAGIRWFDREGNVLSTTTATSALTANTWTRCAVTGVAPSGTVAAAPVLYVSGVVERPMWLDQAFFGFGSITTYADGDTAGWRWTGTRFNSISQLLVPAPDFWLAKNGILSRIAGANRTSYGRYEILESTTFENRVWAANSGDYDAARFRVIRGRKYCWGVDVGVADIAANNPGIQVRPVMTPTRWNGAAWVADPGSPEIYGTAVSVARNQTKRISWYIDVAPVSGNATHFMPGLVFEKIGGGAATAGQVFAIDNAILTDYSNDDTYMDGYSAGAQWLGGVDASASRFVGNSRRIMVEATDGIDFSTTNALLAKFAVSLKAPDVFWEDTLSSSFTSIIPRNNAVISLLNLEGGSAPIYDSVIRVYGPVTSFTLYDEASGARLSCNYRLRSAAEWVDFDVRNFTAKNQSGSSVISYVSHGGSTYLLPLTYGKELTPRIRVAASGLGAGAKLVVTAKRKYHIA